MAIITNNNYNLSVTPNKTKMQGVVQNALVQGTISTTWNIKSGGQSQIVYRGREDQVTAIAKNAQQDGFEYQIQGGHIWTITITFPLDVIVNSFSNEPNPIAAWELTSTPVEQNILEAKDRNMIGGLTSDAKKIIEQNLRNPRSVLPPVPTSNVAGTVNATVVQNLRFAGVEGKLLFVPTLKRTIIVSNRFNPQWKSDSNGKLFTTEQLVVRYGTAAANGGDPKSALPDFLAQVIPISLPLRIVSSANVQLYVEQIGYLDLAFITSDGIVSYVGWLEYPPEYQTISLNKIQISQQWVFNRWSAGPYGLYDPYDGTKGPDPTYIITGGSPA